MKTLTLNVENKCLSVGCDFYQTCNKNTVSYSYKTKYKFDPIIKDNACYSYGSGKNSSFADNCYPKTIDKLYGH